MGEAPCKFLEKKAILLPLDHISQVFRDSHMKKLEF